MADIAPHFVIRRWINPAASMRSDPDNTGDRFRDPDITGVMLSVACNHIRFQVLAAEAGRWSPRHDSILNYMGI
jgi:hypothetical protein